MDFWLQTNLYQSGVLWSLLLFQFNYDFTLEESGVEKSDDTNLQVTRIIANRKVEILTLIPLYCCNNVGVVRSSCFKNGLLISLQEVANRLAKLAVRACARLGGYLPEELATPDNPAVKKSLSAMLTPYLARKLSEDNAIDVGHMSVCN